MDEKFSKAVEALLEHEGGYQNDPNDPGGETNFGISKRSYPGLDIRSLTREQAETIYYRDWWERYGYGGIASGPIAAKVLDIAVNIGPHRAHSLLQEAVNATGGTRLAADGILGRATMGAVNAHACPEYLLSALKLGAVRYYLDLCRAKGSTRYLAGWLRRAVD